MAKVEELQTKVKVLRAKAQEADKNTDKSKLAEARTLHKNLKRAQRKVRAMTGRKLPPKKGEEGKKEAPAAAPTATAPAKPAATPVAAPVAAVAPAVTAAPVAAAAPTPAPATPPEAEKKA